MHPGLAVAVAEIVENTAVFIFPYKGLGYPDAVNAFCDIGIQVGLLVGRKESLPEFRILWNNTPLLLWKGHFVVC